MQLSIKTPQIMGEDVPGMPNSMMEYNQKMEVQSIIPRNVHIFRLEKKKKSMDKTHE